MCRGSNEWVHLQCLQEWQKSVLLTQSTHPKYQTSIDRICNVCLEPFTGKGIPSSRKERILQYLGGGELAKLVTPGNLLVSTRDSSRENLELIEQHPEIKKRLMTWTKAVFLMISTGINASGLLAVSMSQPIDAPPSDVRLSSKEKQIWQKRTNEQPWMTLQHYDGGPMERDEPMAIAHACITDFSVLKNTGVQFVAPFFLYGMYENVMNVLNVEKYRMQKEITKIHVVWGCGGWGGTQVLAEIARGACQKSKKLRKFSFILCIFK